MYLPNKSFIVYYNYSLFKFFKIYKGGTIVMTTTLARNWWVLALRGLIAILFGIVAFIWPGLTLVSLVLLFGAYALLDGIFSIIAA